MKNKQTPKRKKAAAAIPKRKKQSEEERSNQSLLKRVIFGEEKPDLTELEAGSTTILDILSPTTVDTKSKDYIVVDGVYHTYLYITGYGYTTTVGSCWLAPLVEAGEGINMSFLVKRQSKEKILSKISQTTMMNRSRMREVGDTRQDYEELDSAISSGLYLKDVMNRQGEDFYYMHTLIEVTAPDPETLEQRATEVEKLCVSVDMIARRCDYKNEQAFLSSLPILSLDPDIERKARRNALTSGVAAAFPFASYELSDHNGIFLGLNLYNRSPVFLDPYDDYKYTNGNWWIGGSTGAGKTVTLQCLGGRLRQQGKRVIIIAPKKGHEFRPLCEKLGGLYLRMSPSSKDCPNLMAIRRRSLDSYAKLKNIAVRDDSVLADKISQLIIWFSLKKKDLSEEDKSRLDSSLVEVYGRYGITFENIRMDGVLTPIVMNMWYNCVDPDRESEYVWTRKALPVDERTPHLGSFVFRNLECTGAHAAACSIDGLPERPIDAVTLEDISVSFAENALPAIPAMRNFAEPVCRMGLYFENVGKIRLKNVRLSGVVGDAVITKACGALEQENLEVR